MKSSRIRAAFAASLLLLIEIAAALCVPSSNFIRYSGGDFLVVILLYCAVQAVRPVSPIRAGTGVFLFALTVEFLQCANPAKLMGFAPDSAAAVIMGSVFSVEDIIMYLLGTAAAVFADVKLRKLKSEQ